MFCTGQARLAWHAAIAFLCLLSLHRHVVMSQPIGSMPAATQIRRDGILSYGALKRNDAIGIRSNAVIVERVGEKHVQTSEHLKRRCSRRHRHDDDWCFSEDADADESG